MGAGYWGCGRGGAGEKVTRRDGVIGREAGEGGGGSGRERRVRDLEGGKAARSIQAQQRQPCSAGALT